MTADWPVRPAVVIAASAVLALALRLFQLSRPGHLSGFTQYDDGVYFGNALRLVHGAIAYRDFAMVHPPGSMLLMTPVALAARAFGTAWGLGAARLLTALADTANVVLIGLLVRRRGTLAAGLACAGYAVYPAALVASQTLLLEPWLNRSGSVRASAAFAAVAALVIAVLVLASIGVSARLRPAPDYAAAGGVIPPGACVVTDTASATIAVNRFVAASPGCPQLVDSVGTLIATTGGQDLVGSQAVRAADTRAWRQAFSRARYVWLIGNQGDTGARIAWTRSLSDYFGRHFRLLRYASAFRGHGNVPRGGLYVRRLADKRINACVALVGQRLAGARAGLLAGLVFALVPSVSRFAQEVRFYALAVLVATLATLLLLLRALDRPSALRWLAYAASLALLGYVDVVALSVLAGHSAGAVLTRT